MDDKAEIAVQAATLQAWEGKPLVGVAAFIEGEEELGSAHLPEFLSKYEDLLRADAVVLASSRSTRLIMPCTAVVTEDQYLTR